MGIVRIEDLSELISFAILHRCGRSFEGKRVVILSGSGGRGVMLADKCERLGLAVPEITGTTRARLEEALPAFGSAMNPVDMTAGSGGDHMTPDRCLRALIDDENSDIVVAQPYFHHGGGMPLAEEFLKLYHSTDKPIVLLSHRRARVDEDDEPGVLVEKAGVPVLTDATEMVQAMADLAWYQQKVKRFREAEQSPQPRVEVRDPRVEELLGDAGPLTEFDCKQILKGYEIPITREGLAGSADEAVELARELGYPVVLKVQSGQILHKTEAGGIALNLDSDEQVRDAYDAILASAKSFAPDAEIQGVLVQEMVGDGVEVIVGVTQDPVFGPAIMFGLGGIFVEALRDVSFRVAPLLRPDAEDMLDEIRGRRVLEGMRGKSPADREALIDVILKVSQLVCDHRDRIEELDINPLMVFPKGAKALDALITRRGG
jgi:acetyltransferase